MTKALRLVVLTSLLALTAAPVFADPGSNDPPPPGKGTNSSVTTTDVILTVLTSLGA